MQITLYGIYSMLQENAVAELLEQSNVSDGLKDGPDLSYVQGHRRK